MHDRRNRRRIPDAGHDLIGFIRFYLRGRNGSAVQPQFDVRVVPGDCEAEAHKEILGIDQRVRLDESGLADRDADLGARSAGATLAFTAALKLEPAEKNTEEITESDEPSV